MALNHRAEPSSDICQLHKLNTVRREMGSVAAAAASVAKDSWVSDLAAARNAAL